MGSLSNQSAPFTQTVSATLSGSVSTGTPTYSVQVNGFSYLYTLEQELDLQEPSDTTNYDFNIRGGSEEYLQSGNGSNSANAGYYVLTSNGNLYAWTNNSLSTTETTEYLIANVGAGTYVNPTLLTNAQVPYNTAAYGAEQSLADLVQDADGHPRTTKAHTVERFTRPELGKVVIDITIDDPGAYSKPWNVHEVAQLAPGWEIMENICNENQDAHGNNLDVQHLVGK